MRRFSLKPAYVSTRMNPVAAHVAHIRHLARSSALAQFLRDRHGFTADKSQTLAREVAPFLDQALLFHDSSQNISLRVRPVLQYYAYLNFAVALVLIYQPNGWQEYRKHGAEDTIRSLQSISLSSPVVQVRSGAVPLFNSIISSGILPRNPLKLRDVLSPIPMIDSELRQAFGIKPLALHVDTRVQSKGEGADERISSVCEFTLIDPANLPSGTVKSPVFPLKRLYKTLPDLQNQYTLIERSKTSCVFESKQKWTPGNKDRAEKFHDGLAFKLVNFGSQQFQQIQQIRQLQIPSLLPQEIQVAFFWRFERNSSSLLPMLTAGLLLSFVLASLSRYRANVLDRIENSKINLLCEVFSNEADGFMIPAFRNLLYAESMYMSAMQYT